MSGILIKNLANAQLELRKLTVSLTEIQQLYLKPARLIEELRSTTRAIDNINRTIQRLEKRIEIKQALEGKNAKKI